MGKVQNSETPPHSNTISNIPPSFQLNQKTVTCSKSTMKMMMTIIASSSTTITTKMCPAPISALLPVPSTSNPPWMASWGRMDSTPARRPPHSSPSTPAISHTSRRRDSGRQRPPPPPTSAAADSCRRRTLISSSEFLWSCCWVHVCDSSFSLKNVCLCVLLR